MSTPPYVVTPELIDSVEGPEGREWSATWSAKLVDALAWCEGRVGQMQERPPSSRRKLAFNQVIGLRVRYSNPVGRAGPGSTGRGAIKAPPRTAALSAAFAAGRTGSEASARLSPVAGSFRVSARAAAFCVSTGGIYPVPVSRGAGAQAMRERSSLHG